MPSYLGVDLGSRGVKVIQLDNDRGRGRLATYGYEVIPAARTLTDITKREEQETIAALRAVLAKAKVTTKKAIGALPTFSVFSSLLTLPQLPKKELEEAIRWEAKKVIPLPIEEMILDSKVVESWGQHAGGSATATAGQAGSPQANAKSQDKEGVITEKKRETTHIFLTAAPKTLVERTIRIFREAGLELLSLETEVLALGRALLWSESAPVIIVDVGASTTTMAVVIEQIPVLSRSIEFGGSKLSAALANSLHVPSMQAEMVKQHLLQVVSVSPESVTRHAAPLLDELKYLVSLYERSDLTALAHGRTIEKIILTGGGAQYPGIAAAITQAVNMTALLGDPWARVAYPVELKPVLDTLAGTFAIPIGLALREIEVTK